MTSGGRGLTVIDASLELRNQSESSVKDALSVLCASVLVSTSPRVLKNTLTTVTVWFVRLKSVEGR